MWCSRKRLGFRVRVLPPVGHIRYVACGAVLPMLSGTVLQMYISMSQYAVRPLLVALWPTGHVAPVEQCCLCPVGHIRYVACGADLCPVGPSYRCIYSMSQHAVRLLLSAFWPTGYVAPVGQCCLCPVGLIRYVACAAVLPIPSGAVLQMYIFLGRFCCAMVVGWYELSVKLI